MISMTSGLILFGVLVLIHEFGHFVIAKWSGVFVERFAIGFGPVLLRKKWGETEYALCAFPLGGYVKMRGEEEEGETPSTDPRSFANQPVWVRMAIVAMGPICNFILPIVVFSILFWVGTEVPSSQIGSVIPGYPAEQSMLKPGDKVLSVEGQSLQTWKELTEVIGKRIHQPTSLQIERDGKTFTTSLTPISEEGPNMYGEIKPMGRIGIDLIPFRPVIGISNSQSVAGKAGLKTGDVVVSVNEVPTSFWWKFEEAFQPSRISKKIIVERIQEGKPITLSVEIPAKLSLSSTGIENGELFLREVRKKSVAEEKGLLPGDKLLTLNQRPLSSWYEFRKGIEKNQGESVTLGILRNQIKLQIELIPKEVTEQMEITKDRKKTRQLGVVSCAEAFKPGMWKEQYSNPFLAFSRGLKETWEVSSSTVIGLGKLISGKLSLGSLGGPISIFYLAGSSYKMGGLDSFFRMLAVISITLAILNVLPIPILDGGHLLFFLIEAIKGSPVSLRIRNVGQQVGMVLLVGLMVLVFYVDINRFVIGWIKSLFG